MFELVRTITKGKVSKVKWDVYYIATGVKDGRNMGAQSIKLSVEAELSEDAIREVYLRMSSITAPEGLDGLIDLKPIYIRSEEGDTWRLSTKSGHEFWEQVEFDLSPT